MSNSEALQRLSSHKTATVYSIEFGSDVDRISTIVGQMEAKLAAHWPESIERSTRLTAALQEAVSNAVYHGNLGLSSKLREGGGDQFLQMAQQRKAQSPWRDRVVQVTLAVTDQTAEFVIRDEGDGFDLSTVRSCVDGSGLFRISGRGIAMMEILMDEVEYSNGGRTLTLRLHRQVEVTAGSRMK